MAQMTIRPLHTLSELAAIEPLEQRIWGMDDRELISTHTLHAIVHSGGQVLGAFDGDTLAGFAVCLLGTMETPRRRDQVAAARLQLYSMIAGVHPDYQNHGVGFQLKLAQREFALTLGVRLITWTYDPLESRNARFNIGKLGAVCNTYHRDFHGEMSGINAGIATDRFQASWWITSNRVARRVTNPRGALSLSAFLGAGAAVVNKTAVNGSPHPLPAADPALPADLGALLLVEIPSDFQALKRNDLALAQTWRAHTRLLFESLFARGYVVTDFVQETANGRSRSFYLLTHEGE